MKTKYTATFQDGTTHTRNTNKDLTHAAKVWYADDTNRTLFASRLSELKNEIELDRQFAPEYYEGAEIEIVELEVAL